MDSRAFCAGIAANVAITENKLALIQNVGVRNPTIGRQTTR
jgi:hypothetical protein